MEERQTPKISASSGSICCYFIGGSYGYQAYTLSLRQMRKVNIFVKNHGGVIQIGIDEVLQLGVIKKVYSADTIVAVINAHNDV